MAKKIVPTLGYFDGKYLAAAVLRVFRYNEKYAAVASWEATADAWTLHTHLRADIFVRTRAEWCKLTEKDFTWFPFSEDAVARLYARFCKRSPDEIDTWEKELNEAVKP